MADILIRGMEMPKCCALCDLEHWDEDAYGDEMNHRCCMYRKGYTAKVRETGRLPDCPLVPLPEGHGRIGDLDKIVSFIDYYERPMDKDTSPFKALNAVRDYICNASNTIILAEGGTDDVRCL